MEYREELIRDRYQAPDCHPTNLMHAAADNSLMRAQTEVPLPTEKDWLGDLGNPHASCQQAVQQLNSMKGECNMNFLRSHNAGSQNNLRTLSRGVPDHHDQTYINSNPSDGPGATERPPMTLEEPSETRRVLPQRAGSSTLKMQSQTFNLRRTVSAVSGGKAVGHHVNMPWPGPSLRRQEHANSGVEDRNQVCRGHNRSSAQYLHSAQQSGGTPVSMPNSWGTHQSSLSTPVPQPGNRGLRAAVDLQRGRSGSYPSSQQLQQTPQHGSADFRSQFQDNDYGAQKGLITPQAGRVSQQNGQSNFSGTF